MLIAELLSRYLNEHPYGLAERSVLMLRCTLSQYARWCGSDDLCVFDCAIANRWLDDLRRRCAPDTVRTQRTNLLCVWWWGYREDYLSQPPLRLRRLRPVHRSPTAWTCSEVRELIWAAEHFPRRSLWTASLVRSGYDTSLRLGDLLRLQVRDVQQAFVVRQHKTGRSVAVQLRPDTLSAVLELVADRQPHELVWPLWGRREAFYRHFRRVVRAAGIRPGTFRWLRRTAATQVELVSPGSGTRLLGHQSRSTTENWYIDRSQLDPPPLPPL